LERITSSNPDFLRNVAASEAGTEPVDFGSAYNTQISERVKYKQQHANINY